MQKETRKNKMCEARAREGQLQKAEVRRTRVRAGRRDVRNGREMREKMYVATGRVNKSIDVRVCFKSEITVKIQVMLVLSR